MTPKLFQVLMEVYFLKRIRIHNMLNLVEVYKKYDLECLATIGVYNNILNKRALNRPQHLSEPLLQCSHFQSSYISCHGLIAQIKDS